MTDPRSSFTDAQAVAKYADGPKRMVPGFLDLQRMARLLLEERVPHNGRVVVLGAGGGLELKVFGDANPHWTFFGVDPSSEMLDLARQNLGSTTRVQLMHGYIHQVPEQSFDGATCLLVLHFVSMEERRRLLVEVRKRLRPGAPFVVAHLSFPQLDGQRAAWLSRYAAFATSSGIDANKATAATAAVDKQLTICSPEEDEALLREAGFHGVDLFYVGMAFRGWVAYA